MTPPSDFVLRIALLRGDDDLTELSPSVWRIFRCSSGINLDAFQDKILQPIMGWQRNYHGYYFKKGNNTYYYQSETSTVDCFGMHDGYRANDGERVNPTEYTLGDVLQRKGDSCYYAYDLGDHWYHRLTVEQVITDTEEKLFGKAIVLDGAMRCPDEDGEGGHKYQEKVLDLYNLLQADPDNVSYIRDYAQACFDRVNPLNVEGRFFADEFEVDHVQQALQDALRSRATYRMGGISPDALPGSMFASKNKTEILKVGPGLRKRSFYHEDLRGHTGGPLAPPFYWRMLEIVNVKPDDEKFALCAACGNPHDLKRCGRCHTARYCSRDCQSADWKIHKATCKQDKRYFEAYTAEKEGRAQVPQGIIDTDDRRPLRKFDPENMRFMVGQTVECMIGHNVWGTGTIIRVLHECEGIVHAYQVQLDRETANKMGVPYSRALIWADWDCDYQIREVDDQRKVPKNTMEIVD